MDISAVTITYNEAEKLVGCLESLKTWVKEIIVVDLGSSDKTLEIAKKFGAKIFPHEYVPVVEQVRNFSLEKASGDWILVVDPDERIPQTLAKKLVEIAEEDHDQAVKIPRKNIIFKKWIKHSNWWPDKHVRFFKKGKVRWLEKVHSFPQVEGKILELESTERLAIEHFNYDSVSQFLGRQNRYSEISARTRLAEGEKFTFWKLLWRPVRVFLQRYLRHAGFLDGFYGLALAFLAFYSQMGEEVKLWEKQRSR